MAKDDWSDLRSVFSDMAQEETKRVKQAVVNTFSEQITTPVDDGGLAPVDTGNWLANNIATESRPTRATNDDLDPDGFDTLSGISYVAYNSKPYNQVIIQNNSDYNDEVEYSGWQKTPAYRPYRTAFEILKGKLEDI